MAVAAGLLIWLAVTCSGDADLPGSPILSHARSAQANPVTSDECAACHARDQAALTTAYAKSTHGKRSIGCSRCHGGDPLASDKRAAHAGPFTAEFSAEQSAATCGACHREQTAAYRASRHAAGVGRAARVDCVRCHGSHRIGTLAGNFSFGYFCTGCHGLEYLPELDRSFRDILAATDDSREMIARFQATGRTAPDGAAALRREIRRRVGELVHATDYDAGPTKAPELMALREQLRSALK